MDVEETSKVCDTFEALGSGLAPAVSYTEPGHVDVGVGVSCDK